MSLAIQPIDLSVLVVYLIAVAALGIAVGRGTRDVSTYLLGDRHLPWWAILGSIVATETSTATFLSVPGITFAERGDMRFLQLALGYIVGRLIIVVTLLPLYFRGEILTAYQVLHQRFGGVTKQTASLIFLVTRNLGDGLRLFLTAIALEEMTGLGLIACIIVIGLITILYTLLGGMKAVVWNDCLQFVVYMAGGLLAGWVILRGLPDGWAGFLEFGRVEGKFRFWDFAWNPQDPYTFWAAFVGGMFLTLGTHGTDQMMVQRLLCASSRARAGVALVLSGGVVLIQFLLFLLLGVGLAAYYSAHPPETPFSRTDRVFATFIVQEFPAGYGLIGVVLAAVFAAAMSTLSSSINSSAASAMNDLYLPLQGSSGLSEKQQLAVTRRFTVVFGIVQIVVAILARELSQSVVEGALTIAGFSAGLLLGVFALGVLTKRVGQGAAVGGLLLGLVVLGAVYLVGRIEPDQAIAWTWFAVIGSISTFAGGIVADRFGIGRRDLKQGHQGGIAR